jgi:hypothetical protein
MRLVLVVLPALLVLPASVRGDSGQAVTPAKTEKKDKPAKPQKVYTDEDLKSAGKEGKGGKGGAVTFLNEPQGQADSGSAHGSSEGGHGGSSETKTATDTDSGGQASAESGAGSEAGGSGELGWRARAREYRQAVRNVQAEIDKVEARLGALRNPQQQPQPIEALQPDPQRRLTKDDERIELDKQLEELRKALTDAQKALDDFLEEARRASVPPGWIEER